MQNSRAEGPYFISPVFSMNPMPRLVGGPLYSLGLEWSTLLEELCQDALTLLSRISSFDIF